MKTSKEFIAAARRAAREYGHDKHCKAGSDFAVGWLGHSCEQLAEQLTDMEQQRDNLMNRVEDLEGEIQSHENVNNLLSEQLTDMEQQRDAWRDDATSYREERDQWRRNAHAWREKMLAVYTQLTEQINEGVD